MDRRTIIIVVAVLLGVILLFGMFDFDAPEETVSVSETSTSNTYEPAATENSEAYQLFEKAKQYEQNRDRIRARQTYSQIIENHPDFDQIEVVQRDLGDVNMELIFSNAPLDEERVVIHTVEPGDTLGRLAKKYGTTIDLIRISNKIKGDLIRVGERLRIWKKPFNIFVDKSQNILLLKADEEVLKVYDISTGENDSTPVGEFVVTTRLKDPVWFNRGIVVPPESPENVLGTRWLGFDKPGYGIHGTVEPEKIGQSVTAGCVRMRNEEVEELYSIIPLGTKVVITE